MSNLLETSLLNDEQKQELKLYLDAIETYYTEESIMSDVAFDELEKRLLSYDIGPLTSLIEKSIYRKVNGVSGELINVENAINNDETKHMLISILKYKFEGYSELRAEIIKQLKAAETIYYGPKLDGAALKIEWELAGDIAILKMIQTRGGLDVTEKFRNIKSIVNSYKFGKKIIAGELVIDKKLFNQYFSDEVISDGYDNPRNFIGSLMKTQKIPQSTLDKLTFIPCTDGTNPLLETGMWKNFDGALMNIVKINQFYKSEDFPYMCDGIVLANIQQGERQIKNNYPTNLLAIKFQGERVQTRVNGFLWTQKKSGKLTPKLLLEPVRLDGCTASTASIYNHRYLKESGVGIGSIVEIEKSNDIIPVFVKAITKTKVIEYPKVSYKEVGINLVAIDLEISRKFKFSSALKSLSIDGIGEVLSKEIGEVVNYDIIELFNVSHKADICKAIGGADRWQKFQDFYNIKTLYLDKLIHLLQFDQVGPVIAYKISMLIVRKSNDTSNIPSEVLQNVAKGEGFEKIKQAIGILREYGINVIAPIEHSDDLISFEMTGNPPGITKQDFVKKLKELFPNSSHESLKKDTKYLFCDNISSNSGKTNKARKYGVKLVTYEDALKGKI